MYSWPNVLIFFCVTWELLVITDNFFPPPLKVSWITILMLVTKLRHIVLQICRTWTLDIFSRSTLAEFSNCPSALWIRYLNLLSGGWYVYRLVKVSVLAAEIRVSVKTGGSCKKDKHFPAQQSIFCGQSPPQNQFNLFPVLRLCCLFWTGTAQH